MHLIIRLIALCIISQLAITWKLWVPVGRHFPLVSAFEFLPIEFGAVGDAVLSGLLVASLVFLLLRPLYRIAFVPFAFVSILLVLEDITRLQPWLYTFALMLLLVVGMLPRQISPEQLPDVESQGSSTEQRVWDGLLFTLAALYFWGGFHKLNVDFTAEIFPWMLNPFGLREWALANTWLAWCAAIFEMLTGIGLLFGSTRRSAAVTATLMHFFIITVLMIQGWNWSVLPWNAALIALVWIVATKNVRAAFLQRRRRNHGSSHAIAVKLVVLSLMWIAPALFLFDVWDGYLSHSLYSGASPDAIFYFHTNDRGSLSQVPSDFLHRRNGTNEEFLLLPDWCMHDVLVPYYPAERYFRRIGAYLCGCVERKDSAGIRVSLKRPFTSKSTLKEFPCSDLFPAR